MRLTDAYRIDGQALPVPDEDVSMTFTDREAEESCYDEAGFYHRIPLRSGVGRWELSYSRLSPEEYAYLRRCIDGKRSFLFARPGQEQSLCMVTACSVKLGSLNPTQYRSMKLRIEEC